MHINKTLLEQYALTMVSNLQVNMKRTFLLKWLLFFNNCFVLNLMSCYTRLGKKLFSNQDKLGRTQTFNWCASHFSFQSRVWIEKYFISMTQYHAYIYVFRLLLSCLWYWYLRYRISWEDRSLETLLRQLSIYRNLFLKLAFKIWIVPQTWILAAGPLVNCLCY